MSSCSMISAAIAEPGCSGERTWTMRSSAFRRPASWAAHVTAFRAGLLPSTATTTTFASIDIDRTPSICPDTTLGPSRWTRSVLPISRPPISASRRRLLPESCGSYPSRDTLGLELLVAAHGLLVIGIAIAHLVVELDTSLRRRPCRSLVDQES